MRNRREPALFVNRRGERLTRQGFWLILKNYAKDANLANWLDAHYLPGRLWDRTRDPEGMLSTLPAIATCLLGIMAGVLLFQTSLVAKCSSTRSAGLSSNQVARSRASETNGSLASPPLGRVPVPAALSTSVTM